MTISRRTLLLGTAALASAQTRKLKVAIFSKHLQFLAGEELPRAAAEIGFDGIDITVRKGGHVEPSRVKQDLPLLVNIIRKQGLEVPMVTTDIIDVQSSNARDVLSALSNLGIRYYRWAGLNMQAMRRSSSNSKDSGKDRRSWRRSMPNTTPAPCITLTPEWIWSALPCGICMKC